MANRFAYRIKNPRGLRLCFYEEITLFDDYSSWRKLYRNTARYIRYSLHSGVGIRGQSREVKHIFTWIAALPEGVSDWMVDLLRKSMKN